jgi:hypothetical protein
MKINLKGICKETIEGELKVQQLVYKKQAINPSFRSLLHNFNQREKQKLFRQTLNIISSVCFVRNMKKICVHISHTLVGNSQSIYWDERRRKVIHS